MRFRSPLLIAAFDCRGHLCECNTSKEKGKYHGGKVAFRPRMKRLWFSTTKKSFRWAERVFDRVKVCWAHAPRETATERRLFVRPTELHKERFLEVFSSRNWFFPRKEFSRARRRSPSFSAPRPPPHAHGNEEFSAAPEKRALQGHQEWRRDCTGERQREIVFLRIC